jgi:hypothetical protein
LIAGRVTRKHELAGYALYSALTKLGVRRHGCCYVIVSWCVVRVVPRRSLR